MLRWRLFSIYRRNSHVKYIKPLKTKFKLYKFYKKKRWLILGLHKKLYIIKNRNLKRNIKTNKKHKYIMLKNYISYKFPNKRSKFKNKLKKKLVCFKTFIGFNNYKNLKKENFNLLKRKLK